MSYIIDCFGFPPLWQRLAVLLDSLEGSTMGAACLGSIPDLESL